MAYLGKLDDEREEETLALPWAIILSLLAAVTMAMDAHFTWHRYLLGQRIADRKVPTWQMVAVRTYIWFFFILPWVGMVTFLQLDERSDGLNRKPKWDKLYLVGAIHCLLLLPMHILWSGLMFFSFVRSVNSLRVQTEAQPVLGSPVLHRVQVLQSVSIRSGVYVGISLVMYTYCWFIFCIYPYSAFTSVTAMPYQILMALATHLCFNFHVSCQRAKVSGSGSQDATEGGGVGEAQPVRAAPGPKTQALSAADETEFPEEFLQQMAQELGNTQQWPLFLRRADPLAGGLIIVPRPQQPRPPAEGQTNETDGSALVGSPPLPVPEPHERPTSARRRKQHWRLWRLPSPGLSGPQKETGSGKAFSSLSSLSQPSPASLRDIHVETSEGSVKTST